MERSEMKFPRVLCTNVHLYHTAYYVEVWSFKIYSPIIREITCIRWVCTYICSYGRRWSDRCDKKTQFIPTNSKDYLYFTHWSLQVDKILLNVVRAVFLDKKDLILRQLLKHFINNHVCRNMEIECSLKRVY